MSTRRKIRELDYTTEQIVRYERENDLDMGEAFEGYEQALDWLYEAIEDEPDYQLDHSEHEEFFELMMKTGLHKTDQKEMIWKLEKRLEEYRTQGYDQTELITRYKLEAEELGKTPSARDARNADHMPTETSYKNSFEDWSNARWRAGHTGHEKLGTGLLLEKLNNHIHEENEERPIDEYQIPTGPELDEAEDGPSERALRNDEEIGSLEHALEQLGFQHLREEKEQTGKWMSEEIRPEEAPKEEALD